MHHFETKKDAENRNIYKITSQGVEVKGAYDKKREKKTPDRKEVRTGKGIKEKYEQ